MEYAKRGTTDSGASRRKASAVKGRSPPVPHAAAAMATAEQHPPSFHGTPPGTPPADAAAAPQSPPRRLTGSFHMSPLSPLLIPTAMETDLGATATTVGTRVFGSTTLSASHWHPQVLRGEGDPRITDAVFARTFSSLHVLAKTGRGQAAPCRRFRGVDIAYGLRPSGSDSRLTGKDEFDRHISSFFDRQTSGASDFRRRATGHDSDEEERRNTMGSRRPSNASLSSSIPSGPQGGKPTRSSADSKGFLMPGGSASPKESGTGTPSPDGTPRSQGAPVGGRMRRVSNTRRRISRDQQIADFNKRVESLKRVALLADLEATIPGIIFKLAQEAKLVHEHDGQVVMRQGDNPGMFCVLTSGHVGVFKVPQEELNDIRDRDPVKALSEVLKLPTISEYFARFPEEAEKMRPGEPLRRSNGELVKFKTSDGCSSYTQETIFGKQILAIGPDNIFGELALLHGDRRKATIRCLGPCELLKFKAQDFMASGMQAAMQKYSTFDKYVPDCGSLHGMGRHPASFFRLARFTRGHTLITEGTMAEACIFLVQRGEVEFERTTENDDPVCDLAGATLKMSLQRPQRPSETWDEACEGALFCSLAALPIQAYEPFTVRVVSDEAEVLYARSSRIRTMPIEILQPLRDQLLKTTFARIRQAASSELQDALGLGEGKRISIFVGANRLSMA